MKISRAIPIDKGRLRELAKELTRVIALRTSGREGPLGKRTLVSRAPYGIRAVDGRSLNILIDMESIPTTNPYYVVSGGLGHTSSGSTVLKVFINGSLDAANINRAAEHTSKLVADQLYAVLIHEVTHAADVFSEGVGKRHTKEELENNPDLYYNHPTEVRAYLQEILAELDEAMKHVPKLHQLLGPSKGTQTLLRLSRTWQEIEDHLNEANKRLIMKAVAQKVREYEPAVKVARRYREATA